MLIQQRLTFFFLFLLFIGGMILIPQPSQAATCACYFGEPESCAETFVENGEPEITCRGACLNKYGASLSSIGGIKYSPQFDEEISFDCTQTRANATTANASSTTDKQPEIIFARPFLNVDIPTVSFTQPTMKGGIITSNTLSEYISGVYDYLLIITITLAIIMVMIGGLQYSIGGASSGQQEKGKERIKNGITGVILLFSVYLILSTINPALTVLRQIELENIEGVDTLVFENTESYSGTAKPISDSTFDDTFKAYANCIGIDWRILKVVAYKESGLNPTIVNKLGFTGLFQTKQSNCESTLASYPKLAAQCNDLTNPSVNTAVGTMLAKSGFRIIDKKCHGSLDAADTMTLIYLAHNSGPGSVSYILDHGGCEGGMAIRDGIIAFWDQHKNGAFKGKQLGEKRYPFARQVGELVLAQGVTELKNVGENGSAQCPLQ